MRFEFQSTPAEIPAGDWSASRRIHCVGPFQSTPAEIPAGDLKPHFIQSTVNQFQSTPAEIPAGDMGLRVIGIRSMGFNPRPPKFQRATRVDHSLRHRYVVSIHARRNSSGRPGKVRSAAARHRVSIHARRNSSGRPAFTCRCSGRDVFQSTPAEIPAGDLKGH